MSAYDEVPNGNAWAPRLPRWMPPWVPGAAHALLRVIVGALYTQHGLQKLFGVLAASGGARLPAPLSLQWVAGVLETVGGPLIVLGLLTRPVAFLLSGEMAVAYFKVHAPRGFFPILNRGEVVVLFCFVYLYLFATGAGPYSVDALLSRRRGTRTGASRAPAGRPVAGVPNGA